MGNSAMELSQEQKNAIGDYVRSHYQDWITPFTENRAISEREMEIRERIVRVEESLDKQIELLRQGFSQVDQRFEQVEKRFEQVDKRFNQMFAYFTTGIVLLGVLISAFQVFG